jgi:hypothetical protein
MMTDTAVLDWLLEGDPSIRFQTLRDLTSAPRNDVAAEQLRVATQGWGRRLLDMQDPEGTWAHGLYSPKWTSTTYTLMLLFRMGLPAGTDEARTGVGLIWDGATYIDGGLTSAKTTNAPEGCITAMYVTLASYFRYEDPRIDDAVAWMLRCQMDDGGWNCRMLRSGATHGSFHTTISTLEALAEYQAWRGPNSATVGAIELATEFLLAHRLYKSHRTGTVADAAFTRLSFPPRWHYDVLRALDFFQSIGATWDERFHDAMELLAQKQFDDGTWPLQQRYSGKQWFSIERIGHPSRWNTLRALRVLRWANSF